MADKTSEQDGGWRSGGFARDVVRHFFQTGGNDFARSNLLQRPRVDDVLDGLDSLDNVVDAVGCWVDSDSFLGDDGARVDFGLG
jgi:hypothetical protein